MLKNLVSSGKSCTFAPHFEKCPSERCCIALPKLILGYGVMVTLQILVLPFLVRVRVPQPKFRIPKPFVYWVLEFFFSKFSKDSRNLTCYSDQFLTYCRFDPCNSAGCEVVSSCKPFRHLGVPLVQPWSEFVLCNTLLFENCIQSVRNTIRQIELSPVLWWNSGKTLSLKLFG